MFLQLDLPRRRLVATGALALAACLSIPATARAQSPSLGELAQKEQERRKGLAAAGKVISNKDLPAAAAPAAPAPGAPAPPATGPADKTAKDGKATEAAPAGDEKNEAWWHDRVVQAREAQRRGEAFAEALQSRINALTTDAVNRDDPYQRAKLAEDRQKAIAELARVTSEIDQAKKAQAAIEEEARQAGVPPGWVR